MRKCQKTRKETRLLQQLFFADALPLVLFCIETVPKAGHWLLKYNYSSTVEGTGFSQQKHLTLRARLRYLKNSDHCIKWTSCSSLHA